MKRAQNQTPCTLSSLQRRETQTATAAASTDRWLLLEVPGGWAAKAPQTPNLPASVVETWDKIANIPRARMQFIKQHPTSAPERRIYVGSSGDTPWWMTWVLPEYDALSGVEVAQWLLGDLPPDATPVQTPFYLVCTHGKRDECCAKYGMSVYRAMHSMAPGRVWQSSHIGGHRFAATVLAFPTGHCFGRLDARSAEALFHAYEAEELSCLTHVRGRTAWSHPEQAAEHYLRASLGWMHRNAIGAPLRSEAGAGENEWDVTFSTPEGLYRVTVHATETGLVYGSCLKTSQQPILEWQCQRAEAV